MIRICMAGARGRMGRRILELAAAAEGFAVGGAFDLPEHAGEVMRLADGAAEAVLAPSASEALTNADALIDFSVAEACVENARAAAEQGKPAVVGTTGLSAEQLQTLKDLSRRVALVHAPNMSVGVNLLFKLTAEVAQRLGLDYNVEITEIHHNQKKDSPSGTAARLGECAAEVLGLDYGQDVVHGRHGMPGARPQREIGMHALRGGDVSGEHTVSFIGQGERVELTHKAHSRDNFAQGALRAAQFATGATPGLYDMQDVLGLR